MAGVSWPAVRAYLVAQAPGVLTGYTVYDGAVVKNDAPTHYLTVGDQPSQDDDRSGEFEQGVGPDGFSALESGSVLCELGATSGDPQVPDTFAAFALLAAHLQANQTLGGALSPGSTVTASATVSQEQNRAGAVQRLLVSIDYTTRIPL